MQKILLMLGIWGCMCTALDAVELGPDTLTLGVFCEPVDPTLVVKGVEDFKWPTDQGAVVNGVAPSSPAVKAGFGRFDVIVRVAGEKVAHPDDIDKILAKQTPKKRLAIVAFVPQYPDNKGDRLKWKRKAYRVAPILLKKLFEKTIEQKQSELSEMIILQAIGTPDVVNDRSGLVARVVRSSNGDESLMLTIKYVAEDWLFVKSLIVKTPQGKVELGGLDMQRDNTSTIWEWCTINVDKNPAALKALHSLQTVSNAELFYVGQTYQKKVSLHNEDLVRLRLMMLYYEYLKKMPEQQRINQ